MKIFIDSADINEIRRLCNLNIIDGVTTNPSLIVKIKNRYEEALLEICNAVDGTVSAEVLSNIAHDMVKEGKLLSKLHRNIVVKVPLNNEGLIAIKRLSSQKIKVNATLVFSALQALLAAKAGAYYVSIFVGRLDDIGVDGLSIVKETVEIFKKYNLKTQVLVASIRNTQHVLNSALSGVDIATCPPTIIDQMIKHPLTDIGLKKFKEDYEANRNQ